ncbi:MAG: cyanophycinase [Chitinophagales bacterium]
MSTPKGKLIPVGGAEDKGTDLEQGIIQRNNLNFFELGILRRVVETVGGNDARIEVVTTASSIPDEVGQNYLDAFGKIGCKNIGHLRLRNRHDALLPEVLDRIRTCDAVMFSGGNQLRLTATFGGTEFLDIIKRRYEQEAFVIAGTSAGAMAMSNTMIYEGNAANAHLKGQVKITTGLAFIQDVIIDSHFDKRGRFGRLAQAVAANPSALGIGLGEDTGVIISNGGEMETIGSGAVTIIDGHGIRHNNIADIEDGSPISIEGLLVHLMEKGNRFNCKTRVFEAANVNVVD